MPVSEIVGILGDQPRQRQDRPSLCGQCQPGRRAGAIEKTAPVCTAAFLKILVFDGR